MEKKLQGLKGCLKANKAISYKVYHFIKDQETENKDEVYLEKLCHDKHITFDHENNLIILKGKGAILEARHTDNKDAIMWLEDKQEEYPEYKLTLTKHRIPNSIPPTYITEFSGFKQTIEYSTHTICVENYQELLQKKANKTKVKA